MTERQYKELCRRLDRLEALLVNVTGPSPEYPAPSSEIRRLELLSKIKGAGSVEEQLAYIDRWNAAQKRQGRAS